MSGLGAGATGALAGLAFGFAEYVVVTRMIGRALAAQPAPAPDLSGIDAFEKKMKPIKLTLLGSAFIAMPAIGYVAGVTLGS